MRTSRLAAPMAVLALLVAVALAQVPGTAIPKSAEHHLDNADGFLKRGAWAEAQRCLEQGVAELPEAPIGDRVEFRILTLLARMYRQNGNHERAKDHAVRLLAALNKVPPGPIVQYLIEATLQLADDHTNLKNPGEARRLLKDLLANKQIPMKNMQRFNVLTRLASLEEFSERPDLAEPYWKEITKLAPALLEKPLNFPERLDCTKWLLCALEALKSKDAPVKLKELRTLVNDGRKLGGQVRQQADLLEIQLLTELAMRRGRRRDFDGASKLFQEVRELTPDADLLAEARLDLLQGDLWRSAGYEQSAAAEFRKAVEKLNAHAANLAARQGGAELAEVWRQLRNLHQQLGDLPASLETSERLVARLTADAANTPPRSLLEARSVHGSLLGAAGKFADALPVLEKCVEEWRQVDNAQRDLASVINNLGAVHRSRGDYAAAANSLKEALQIREELLGEDDPEVALSRNNLASVYVALGEYRKGLETYQQVEQACRDRGDRANALLSTTLLNMAMVYRSQGMVDKAISHCRQSLELQQQEFGASSPNVAGHYIALSTLYRASGNYPEAFRMAEKVLAIAERDKVNLESLAAAAHYNLGIIYRIGKVPAKAREHLEKALAIQKDIGQQAASARTQNFLGLLAFEEKNYEKARGYFEEAADIQHKTGASPQEKYSTLCNLAGVCHELKQPVAAMKHLNDAVKFAEQARAQSTGDEADRATLFARFASAVELQVVWNLEAGDIAAALDAAEQGRSRTFLDQVQLAQGNLRQNLVDANGKPWDKAKDALSKEQELREKINEIQRRAVADDPSHVQAHIRELDKAQEELAQVWSQIRAHSSVYQRMLVKSENLASFADIRQSLLKPGQVLLYYVLGFERSYVVIVDGNPNQKPEAIELKISEEAASRLSQALARRSAPRPASVPPVEGPVKSPAQAPAKSAAAKPPAEVAKASEPAPQPNREVVGTDTTERGDEILEAGAGALSQNLTRSSTIRLVAWYLQLIRSKQVSITREVVGTEQTERGEQIEETSTLLAYTEIFLPAALRQRIRERHATSVLVIPDGALHQLPLEALVVADGKTPRYVLDEFPPIAYAPSASVMLALKSRPPVSVALRKELLSVGNPAYAVKPQAVVAVPKAPDLGGAQVAEVKAAGPEAVALAADVQDAVKRGEATRDAFIALGGRLERLPGTAVECNLIGKIFANANRNVKTLKFDQATEVAVKQLIPRRGYVHLAAHGLVDERHDNLFGALALTPPTAAEAAVSDGFLSYNEILELPLQDCDLAALSACKTNVGPERPLETASSLAQAFLAAGARRVLASHWSVADASTATLMASFFDNVVTHDKGNCINYAEALRDARLKVKGQPAYAEPYFWAPFVLIGPPQTDGAAPANPVAQKVAKP